MLKRVSFRTAVEYDGRTAHIVYADVIKITPSAVLLFMGPNLKIYPTPDVRNLGVITPE